MYAPVRGGNRGGQDQFKWDDVRLMSYKDREQYLGASQKLGYLDKGGKWRKKDWWTEIDDKSLNQSEELRREKEQIKKEDEALMRMKLGLDPQKDTRQLLTELREGEEGSKKMVNKLSEYELKELIQRSQQGEGFGFESQGPAEIADRIGGLGYLNKKQFSMSSKAANESKQFNQLEGSGPDSLKYLDQQKKLVLMNYLKDKINNSKKEKKEMKKAKKDKKQKKDKKKRRHSRSSSESDGERKTIANKDRRRKNSVEKRRDRSEPKPDHRSNSRDKLGERRPHERRERSRSRDRKRHRHPYKDDHDRIKRDDKRPHQRSRRSPSGSKSSSSFLSD